MFGTSHFCLHSSLHALIASLRALHMKGIRAVFLIAELDYSLVDHTYLAHCGQFLRAHLAETLQVLVQELQLLVPVDATQVGPAMLELRLVFELFGSEEEVGVVAALNLIMVLDEHALGLLVVEVGRVDVLELLGGDFVVRLLHQTASVGTEQTTEHFATLTELETDIAGPLESALLDLVALGMDGDLALGAKHESVFESVVVFETGEAVGVVVVEEERVGEGEGFFERALKLIQKFLLALPEMKF